MKQFLNFLIYLFFFIIAFTLLKYAEVLEFDEVSRPGIISRFLIALIVLIAVNKVHSDKNCCVAEWNHYKCSLKLKCMISKNDYDIITIFVDSYIKYELIIG